MRQRARDRMARIGKILSIAMFSLVFFGTGFVGAGPLKHDVAGTWRLADELSGASCRLSLRTGAVAADLAADAPGCERLLPGAGRVTGWRMLPEGGIELCDAAGAPIAVFDVGAATPWEAVWSGLATWFGVKDEQLAEVLPNLKNFNDTTILHKHTLFKST